MKVLYYIHNKSHTEGSLMSLITLVENMKNNGVDVVIAANSMLESSSFFYDFCASHSIPVYYLPVYLSKNNEPVGIKGKFLYFIWVIRALRLKTKCARALNKVVKKEHPDIIHTNTGVLHEGFVVAKKHSIPHVWHLREYQNGWGIYPTKKIYERLLKRSEAVITLTNDIRRRFDLSETETAHVLYNGVYHRDYSQMIMPKQKYFFIASRISKEKGISEIIHEFIKFHNNNKEYDLLIAGEINDSNRSIVDKFKDEKCVKFLGWKNADELKILMSNALALIVNSKYDGFGRMTAEAIFNGCLVIGLNSGGTKEILEETGGGLGYKDYDEFYECMEKVVKMDELSYKEKVSNAQRIAKSIFSIESYVDGIMNVYRKILLKD